MTSKQYEKLTDEIKKLTEEVRELREASQWPRIQYVPVPNYVPYYLQPSYPWWGTGTVIYGNNLPATAQTVTWTNCLATATPTLCELWNGEPQTETA